MVASVLCAASVANAQSFNVGDKNASATIGLGGGYGTPIGLSYEQGISELSDGFILGAGGYFGYSGYNESWAYGKMVYSNIFLAAEGNVHYTKISDKLDLYAGLRLGYNVGSCDVKFDDPQYEKYAPGASAGGFIYTTHVGANYYVTDVLAINLEAGYGLASLSAGVTYRF